MRKKYVNVSLPEDLVKKIDNIVDKGGLGYKSRSEILKEAIRDILIKLKKFDKK